MAVPQTRVFTNNFKPIFSLVIRGGRFCWPWVEAIAFSSSAINPFIYYFRNSDFRRAFRRTFHWLPCVHEQDASHLRAQPERNRLNQNVGTCGNLTAKETEV